jgi:hypothetical protein
MSVGQVPQAQTQTPLAVSSSKVSQQVHMVTTETSSRHRPPTQTDQLSRCQPGSQAASVRLVSLELEQVAQTSSAGPPGYPQVPPAQT